MLRLLKRSLCLEKRVGRDALSWPRERRVVIPQPHRKQRQGAGGIHQGDLHLETWDLILTWEFPVPGTIGYCMYMLYTLYVLQCCVCESVCKTNKHTNKKSMELSPILLFVSLKEMELPWKKVRKLSSGEFTQGDKRACMLLQAYKMVWSWGPCCLFWLTEARKGLRPTSCTKPAAKDCPMFPFQCFVICKYFKEEYKVKTPTPPCYGATVRLGHF